MTQTMIERLRAGLPGLERTVDRVLAVLRQAWAQSLAVIIVLAELSTIHAPVDSDIFARAAVGRLVELTGAPPQVDPFAFSPKLDRWIDHEWLSGVIFYPVTQWGGDLGLLLFMLGLMVATVFVANSAQRTLARHRGAVFPWLFLTMVAALDIWAYVVRSRAFTFLLMAALFWVIARWRVGQKRWLWLVPPMFVLWANLHGGFLAGLGLLGVATLAGLVERRRDALPLVWCLGASTAATLLNPYGVDYWLYVVHAVGMERPGVLEWTAPGLGSWRTFVGSFLIAVFVAGNWKAEKKAPLQAWALLITTILATLSARRFFNTFLLTLLVFGTDSVAAFGLALRHRLGGWWEAGRRVLGVLALGALGVIAFHTAFNVLGIARSGLDYGDYPVDAIRWLETRGEGGDLLVHFNYGSYALWRLYPRYLVSVDGRYEEVYPQSTVDLSHDALDPDAPGHAEALRRLDPDYAIIAVASAGDFGAGWGVVHRDDRFAVMAREPALEGDVRSARPKWEPGF